MLVAVGRSIFIGRVTVILGFQIRPGWRLLLGLRLVVLVLVVVIIRGQLLLIGALATRQQEEMKYKEENENIVKNCS